MVKPSADVVTVDFNTAFGLISGTQEVQAVAQVVFTVTKQVGRQIGVQFEIEGVPTDVPTATGAEVAGPVSYDKYRVADDIRPQPPTTTTARRATPSGHLAGDAASCHATRGAADQRCSRS